VDKQKKLKIALPILFVVLAFVWGPIFFGSSSKRAADNNRIRASNSSQKNTGGMRSAALSRSGSQKKSRSTYTEWGQNPFMLKRSAKALYIEGIMWDDQNPSAIINGNIVGVGDTVESKTIVDIRPNSVIISGDDGEIELRLNE